MILETVATHDLWIWHAYFGMPGGCNDINVLPSRILSELLVYFKLGGQWLGDLLMVGIVMRLVT
jgi:hypothetical protein